MAVPQERYATFRCSLKNGLTTATVTVFYSVKTGTLFWHLLYKLVSLYRFADRANR